MNIVPTDKILFVASDKFESNSYLGEHTGVETNNLMVLLTCEQTIYFRLGSNRYRQEKGLAMESPLFLIITNIPRILKGIAIETTPLKPCDDTLILMS